MHAVHCSANLSGLRLSARPRLFQRRPNLFGHAFRIEAVIAVEMSRRPKDRERVRHADFVEFAAEALFGDNIRDCAAET